MLHSATEAGLEADDNLSETEFKEIIRGKNDKQLQEKLALGDFICQSLYGDSDPRADVAIKRIRRQQEWINEVLAERQQARRKAAGMPEPEPVAIKLNPLRLSGQIKGVNSD